MSEMRQINISVPAVVHGQMAKMAAGAKMGVGPYAAQLFMAAYSARVKPPTGDRDLDAAVGRVAVLYAEKPNTADIADLVGISEPAVIRIIDAWRAEVGMGRAA